MLMIASSSPTICSLTSKILDEFLVNFRLQASHCVGLSVPLALARYPTLASTTHPVVLPQPDKTQAIINRPVPTSAKEVRSFLGLANFYCRFIPQFADIAAPLTALTGSRTPFKWEQAQQSAFTALQQALVSPRVLDYPRPDDRFVLITDASDIGLGAVLSTERHSVVEFASWTLTATEQKYTTTEKECLGILWAIPKFRHYLIGAHFTLETDHKPWNGWNLLARVKHAHSI